MHRNYFTFYHAATELHERLAGGFVFEIHSPRKDELSLSFITAKGEHLQVLVISRIPELSFYTREGMSRKNPRSASLLESICEREVTGVEMSPCDREILVRLSGEETLVLRLFGSEANVLLTRGGVVTDACRSRNTLVGRPYPESGDHANESILGELDRLAQSRERFFGRVAEHRSVATEKNALPDLPGFDRALQRNLVERAGGTENPEALFTIFQDMFYELLDPLVQSGASAAGKPQFSLLHQPLPGAEICSSVLEGLNRYSSAMWSWLHTAEAQRELSGKLQQQLRRTERELQEFSPLESEKKAAEYETCGHLLMGALYRERSAPESINVADIFNPGGADVEIRLKPELNLGDNAAAYFRKASKSRGRAQSMRRRRGELEKRRVELEGLLDELSGLSSPKAVKRFLEAHTSCLRKSGIVPPKAADPSSPFRTFRLSASATLYIGKNARNNEQLTFTFAKPNDIWLHARGSAGSHCVLRGASMQHRDEIHRAAGIAAWHSAAKHSELVPVMYTLKKHVRRAKNLPPGQVVVEREEVILVRPSKDAQ
ncbi:MAG: NFACT RNA binding domain-containing protein [Chlorobium sp.]|uniref:NFACT RNA binding domain-containing protein n=1 Tax=Chlorobium sp. TaxID=1095 RepID=UPI0025C15240|nr:NFACT RNA binding domain-containing protein [Chlorobium sp.]MCF8382738.1 NFACT RNA binding domain-containing protein [Chlorobium sp.]